MTAGGCPAGIARTTGRRTPRTGRLTRRPPGSRRNRVRSLFVRVLDAVFPLPLLPAVRRRAASRCENHMVTWKDAAAVRERPFDFSMSRVLTLSGRGVDATAAAVVVVGMPVFFFSVVHAEPWRSAATRGGRRKFPRTVLRRFLSAFANCLLLRGRDPCSHNNIINKKTFMYYY